MQHNDSTPLNECALIPVQTAISMVWDGLPTTPDRTTVREWIEDGWLGLKLPAVPFRPKNGRPTYRISLRSLKSWLASVEEKAASMSESTSRPNRQAAEEAVERVRAMR